MIILKWYTDIYWFFFSLNQNGFQYDFYLLQNLGGSVILPVPEEELKYAWH